MEAERAREYYLAGEELIPLVDEDSQPALWVLITIYQRLLEKIAQRELRRLPATKCASACARSSTSWERAS